MAEYVIKTQEQIITEMLEQFVNEIPGIAISRTSDIAIKSNVLASQIGALYDNMEWVKKQMTPQTATGQWLDWHCEQKGIYRKAANKATGILTFLRNTPDTTDRLIPAGAECSTLPDRNGNTIRFVTLKDVTLITGSLSVDVEAEAVIGGNIGNVATKAITVMTAPPIGIEKVINNDSFKDGAEQEDDESLRGRYFNACRKTNNGYNLNFYEDQAMTISGVSQSIGIELARGNGTTDIVISSESGLPSQILINEVQALMDKKRTPGNDIKVVSPVPIYINVAVKIFIKDGYLFSEVEPLVRANISSYVAKSGLGGKILLSGLGNAIHDTKFENSDVEVIYDYQIITPTKNVSAQKTEIVLLQNIDIQEGVL